MVTDIDIAVREKDCLVRESGLQLNIIRFEDVKINLISLRDHLKMSKSIGRENELGSHFL